MSLKEKNRRVLIVFVSVMVVCAAIWVIMIPKIAVAAKEKFGFGLERQKIELVENRAGGYWEPVILGATPSAIERWSGGFVNLYFLKMATWMKDWLVVSNVQHIEVALNETGLYGFVNAEPTPYLALDKESLAFLGEKIDTLDLIMFDKLIARLLPLLCNLDLDLVLMFPVGEDQEEITLRNVDDWMLVQPSEEDRLTLHFEGYIHDDGELEALDTRVGELEDWSGADLSFLTMPFMDQITALGVNQVDFSTQGDGLHLDADSRKLLHFAYDERHVNTLLDLYRAMNKTGATPNPMFVNFVDNITRLLAGSDIWITVYRK